MLLLAHGLGSPWSLLMSSGSWQAGGGGCWLDKEGSSFRRKGQRLLPAPTCVFSGLRAVFSVWGEIA